MLLFSFFPFQRILPEPTILGLCSVSQMLGHVRAVESCGIDRDGFCILVIETGQSLHTLNAVVSYHWSKKTILSGTVSKSVYQTQEASIRGKHKNTGFLGSCLNIEDNFGLPKAMEWREVAIIFSLWHMRNIEYLKLDYWAFKSRHCPLQAVWPQESDLTSLLFKFHEFKK